MKKSKRTKFSIFNFQFSIEVLSLSLILILSSCTNPFAPKLADASENISLLSDQKTVDGVFQNFKYSYIFKDTLIYGRLLADDFTFVYYNYDKGVSPFAWGRDEDMLTTYGLFQASQNLNLIWNDVSVSSFTEDSLIAEVTRGFTLKIIFSPGDEITGNGFATFHLVRNMPGDIWKIQIWNDISELK